MFFQNSSKKLLFKILSEEWPLSAKEIYFRVLKLSEKDLSYQAVHKLLLSLVNEDIVVKSGGKYLIDLDWVKI